MSTQNSAEGETTEKMMHVSAQDEDWPVDQRAREALQNLPERGLLKLVVNFEDGEIQYVGLKEAVAPDSLRQHFTSPQPQEFHFYRYRVKEEAPSRVVLIYTSARKGSSTKRLYPQGQRRSELARLALEFGIEPLYTIRVNVEADISEVLLLAATEDTSSSTSSSLHV